LYTALVGIDPRSARLCCTCSLVFTTHSGLVTNTVAAPAPAPASALLTCGSVTARAASRTTRDEANQSRVVRVDAGRSEGACARNDGGDVVDDDEDDVCDAETRSRATVATRRVHVDALA
jgi:hypothetical protein